MDIVYRKTAFKRVFKISDVNINNHLICFEKTINTYLKARNSLHTTRISSLRYVFIVFFEKKLMLKYTFLDNFIF